MNGAKGYARKLNMHRVFIAEDDDQSRTAMRIAFEGSGYHVVTAIDGQDLLQRLESQQADLIVLDLNLPRLSGIEVLCAFWQARANRITIDLLEGSARRIPPYIACLGAFCHHMLCVSTDN